MPQKPPNIKKYFLHEEALIEFIRKENGMPPLKEEREYKDYLREARIRETKSIFIKRLLKNSNIVPENT